MRKNPGEELAVRPNKSQLKRDSAALQELGEQLITATPGKVAKCALPEKLLAALAEYRKLPNSHGAQKRQLQFIGKLMRDLDDDVVERIHQQLNLNVEMEKRRFHQIEQLLTLLSKSMIHIGWRLWAPEDSKERKLKMLAHNSMHCSLLNNQKLTATPKISYN